MKNTNANISLLELFETYEEYILALFELLSVINVDTNISTSELVGMVYCFKNILSFNDDELPSKDIFNSHLAMNIHVKIMGKIVKDALVDDGEGLNIFSLEFCKILKKS